MSQAATLRSAANLDAIRKATELYNANDLDGSFAIIDAQLLKEPNDAQALTLAASILKKAKKLPVAYQLAKRACDLRPERSEVWNTLGHCAQQLWQQDEAFSSYRKALQRAQTNTHRALYLNNIGSVHIDNGEYAKAEPFVRQSLEIDPNDAMARHNLGLVLLAQRQWTEGWKYYSASIGTDNRRKFKYLDTEEPIWDGTKGKTVVIYGEQGLGDEIVAASMFNDAIRDAGRLILDCDHRLGHLFRRSFPGAKVYGTRWKKEALPWNEEDRKIDYSIASFEIGRFYRNADSDFTGTPYLIPCPDRTAMWQSLFASKKKPVIGVAWTGGTWTNAAKFRCLDIKNWQPIFDSIDAHWVSLQYKDATKEIEGTPVVQYPYATLSKDYDDTAALVSALDCVISVPTAVVHLAAALGTPTIAMQSSKPCWKFAGGLAWHPEVKLIPNNGDWSRTVKDTTKALHERLARPR